MSPATTPSPFLYFVNPHSPSQESPLLNFQQECFQHSAILAKPGAHGMVAR
jgi:hypothetical protein